MRRAPSLTSSPPGLAAYVAANPADAAAPGDQAGVVWDRFRADPAYRELLAALMERQGALCLYCEQRLTHPDGSLVVNDYQVEHVLAKSGAPGRALAWRNLVLACGGGTCRHHPDPGRYVPPSKSGSNVSCGQAREDDPIPGDFDPRALDSPERFVTVDVDGVIHADPLGCGRLGLAPATIEEAISLLNLNCERLRLARKKARADVVDWYVPIANAILAAGHLDSAQQDTLLTLTTASRLQPDAHGHLRAFWSTEREALGMDAERWVAANATLL